LKTLYRTLQDKAEIDCPVLYYSLNLSHSSETPHSCWGLVRLSAEKVITIIVEDTNDNSPEFVSVPTGLLSSTTLPGTKITTVLATDR
jgi:hypothetical protein